MRKSKKSESEIQYVFPIGKGWAIKRGDKSILLITDNKREAVAVAKERAKHYEHELIVYGKDGEITARTDYSKKAKSISSKK